MLKRNCYLYIRGRLWGCLRALSRSSSTAFLEKINQALPLSLCSELLEGLKHVAQSAAEQASPPSSEKMVGALARLLGEDRGSLAPQLVDCLRSMVRICPPAYLERVFTKNCKSLLQQVEAGATKADIKFTANLKVLVAVAQRVAFNSEHVVNSNLTQRELAFQLAEKLILRNFYKEGHQLIRAVAATTSNIHNETILELLLRFEPESASCHTRL